jgi:cytochrome c oxidase subunit 1
MNYLIPLQIGARDVAFPRLNAFSYWLFLFGALFLNSRRSSSAAPPTAAGSATPRCPPSRRDRPDGLLRWGCRCSVSHRSASVNFITTVLTMRAPGMTLMRMPVFTWMALVVQFLLLFSLPIITVGCSSCTSTATWGPCSSTVAEGGDPLLWQHLFWLFGHPEVYMLILPAFGIVSEVLPTFSRKPLFGYPFVVFSGIAIGFMGFGVWAHHMFTAGLGPVSEACSRWPRCSSPCRRA